MADEIKIEKGIPAPTQTSRRGVIAQTLKAMEVGDSFIFPLNGRSCVSQKAAIYQHAKDAGVRVVARNEGDSFRVWKVAATRDGDNHAKD